MSGENGIVLLYTKIGSSKITMVSTAESWYYRPISRTSRHDQLRFCFWKWLWPVPGRKEL